MRRFRVPLLFCVVGGGALVLVTLAGGCSSSESSSGPPPEDVQAITKQKMQEMQNGMMDSIQSKSKKK